MTSIINTPNQVIPQMINAYLKTYNHLKKMTGQPIIYHQENDPETIPLISGGGSGHEPSHIGFVGKGMLTAAIYGKIFAPPTAQEILTAIRQVNRGKGVFLIIKNFDADLNVFYTAIQQARLEKIPIKYIVSHDDISVDTKKNFQVRHRGLAGTILLHKILGAASQEGATLEELEQLGLQLSTQIATIGFALTAPHFPGATHSLFNLEDDKISYGIGIHGEEGYRTVNMSTSEELANEIVNKLKMRFRWQEKERFILLVNNLGTTSELEQAIFLNDICQLLDLEGLDICFIKTGKFMTSLDMNGLSVTLCRIIEDKWINFLTAATQAPAW